LLSKRGVPDDALVSIRSGSVRRQGAFSAGKPFRFPQDASATDCVLKVDIMQTIGSGYVVMRPNQTEGKQYEVVMPDNPDIGCELEVTRTDGGAPSPAGEDAAEAAKAKQDAKAYLETTGLLPFVQGVLQVIAKQRPNDPFAAMAKHFAAASDEAVPAQPGNPKSAPASPKAVDAAPVDEAAPKDDAAETLPAAEEKAESDHVDDHKSDTLEELTSPVNAVEEPSADAAAAADTEEKEEKNAAEEPSADAPAAADVEEKEKEKQEETAADAKTEDAAPQEETAVDGSKAKEEAGEEAEASNSPPAEEQAGDA